MRKSRVFNDSCSQLFPCSSTCLSPAFQPYLRSCTREWQANSLLVHAQCCTRMTHCGCLKLMHGPERHCSFRFLN